MVKKSLFLENQMTIQHPHVAIVILNWNGLSDTLECLESVFKNTYPNYSVYVIDNASAKDELSILKESINSKLSTNNQKPVTRFIQSHSNLGFAEGNNVGIRQAMKDVAEYVFTLNNDTVVDPNFLIEAVKSLHSPNNLNNLNSPNNAIGIVATSMFQYYDRTRIDSLGHDLLTCGDSVPRCRGQLVTSNQKQTNQLFGACAGAALYSVNMLRQIGLFDQNFFLNYEDADLSLRAIVQGWRVVHCQNSIIYHKGNVSIGKIKDTAYRIRSQRNMLFAYLNNIPFSVLLLNLPWILLRDILAIFLSILTFHFKITKIFALSRWQIICSFPQIMKKRHSVLGNQRISSFWFWRNQKSWIPIYFRYCINFLLKRNF